MTAEQRRQLDDQGYVVLERFVDAQWLGELLRRVEQLFEEEGENAGHEFKQEPHARRLANLVDKGEMFERVVSAPAVLDLVGHVLQYNFKLSSLNARSTHPHAPESQPLHVDQGLLPDAHGNAVCNSLWMLDDFTPDNGATRVVPGSHTWGRPPQSEMSEPRDRHREEVLITGPAGTVVVYNAHLWHGGTANRTERHRRALHSFYVRRDFPQQQYQKRLLRRETQARLSPAMRELLALDDAFNDELCAVVTGQSGFMK